jgi:hypothetical protein
MTRSNRWASYGSSPGAWETAQIQAGINRVMGDVITRDARYNPQALSAPPKATPVGAVPVAPNPEPVATRGWRSEIDLRLPRARTLSALRVTQLCHTGLRPIRLRQSECKSRL